MRSNSLEGLQQDLLLPLTGAAGLERSCATVAEGLRITVPDRGVERIEARFHGNGFAPHRHDTYALGLTLHGIQTFRYRGIERFSRPGNVIVLHPDEMHDGAAGTEDGLIYRMVYLPPQLVGSPGSHRTALPFVADPVVTDVTLWRALAELLGDLDREPDGLLLDDVMIRVSAGLHRQAGAPARRIASVSRSAVLRAKEFLDAHHQEAVASETLEAVCGLSRYELARQFRLLLGTSPHRYLVMRRLDKAKRLLAEGRSLAGAAADAGFADQAHFTRHFRKAFGMTPGRWSMLSRS